MFAIAEFVSSLISLIVFVAVSGWVLFYWLKRTEDPPLLIFKWVLTVVIYATIIWIVVPEVKKGG